MIFEKINLKEHYELSYDTELVVYIVEDTNEALRDKPALLILPGGSYYFLSKTEKDPIAFEFMTRGYNTFVLNYSTTDRRPLPVYPNPQIEVMAAIDFIKNHRQKYHILGDNLFLMGFSAGGHLAGSYSYLYKDKDIASRIKTSTNLKPTGICLSYPRITMGDNICGSRGNLIGENLELIDKLSIEKNITSDYPPTFAWANIPDDIVDIKNSYLLKEALEKANVKHEVLIFESGWHGMSLANKFVCGQNYEDVMTWVEKCDCFFKSLIR